MTDAEDLPDGWAVATLGEVTEPKVQQGGPSDASSTFTYIDITGVDNGRKAITDPKALPVKEAPSRARQHVRPGDVLVSMTRPNLNAVAVVPENLAGSIASTGFHVLRPKEVLPEWLFMIVRSTAFVSAMSELVQGALYPAVRPSDIRDFTIPIPPLAEQRRIVAKVEELTARSRAARAALAEVPTLLEQFRQSVLASAFRGDLTADWRAKNPNAKPISEMLSRLAAVGRSAQASRATDSTIPGDYALSVGDCDQPSPASWSWTKLTTVAKLETGHTPSRKHPEYWDGTIPWVCIKDASANHGKVVEQTLQNVTQLGLENSAARLLPTGTVCLTRTANSIGYSLVLGKPMATSQDLVGWVCSEAVVPKYLMYLFISERAALYRFAKGSTHPTVYFPEILSFWVCLPPVEEQHEIVRVLEGVLARIETPSDSLRLASDDLDALDQTILAKAFRGELVLQDPADEPAAALLARIRSGVSATRSVERGRVKFYILLLLRTWNKPLGREMLERGLVLMLNADVRRAILGRSKPAPKRGKKPATPPRFVSGLDLFLGEMLDDGDLVPGPEAGFFAEGQHGIDFAAAPQADLDAVRETAEAMKVIHKDKLQATDADIVSALHGEIYELVS